MLMKNLNYLSVINSELWVYGEKKGKKQHLNIFFLDAAGVDDIHVNVCVIAVFSDITGILT